jgi:hypothetical protein
LALREMLEKAGEGKYRVESGVETLRVVEGDPVGEAAVGTSPA